MPEANAAIAPEQQSVLRAAESADRKHQADELAYKRMRPKPLELQAELTAELRQELATEKYLIDGFFKAKLQNQDQEIDLTDIQMIRNLQAVGRHMIDRSRARR